MKRICVKCGGTVVPGVNGLLHGLSASPDGDPSKGIKDSLQAVHYADDCGNPDAEYKGPRLGSPDSDERLEK